MVCHSITKHCIVFKIIFKDYCLKKKKHVAIVLFIICFSIPMLENHFWSKALLGNIVFTTDPIPSTGRSPRVSPGCAVHEQFRISQ